MIKPHTRLPTYFLSNSAPLMAASVAIGLMTLSGCAATSKPTYVSTQKYQNQSCAQLKNEVQRITHYLDSSGKKSVWNTSSVGVGVGIGSGGIQPRVNIGFGKLFSQKDDTSHLLGQRNAMIQAAQYKRCPFAKQLKIVE